MTSIQILGADTELDKYMFERCIALKNIRLPENLKVLNSGLFVNTKRLYNLTIPKGVEQIDSDFISLSKGLLYITIDASMSEDVCRQLMKAIAGSESSPVIYTDLENLDSKAKVVIEETCELKNIELQTKTLKLNVGKSYELRMTGSAKCESWNSSDPSVATVSYYGKVTAKKAGTAVITATLYGKEYQCTVTVQ